MLSVVSETGNIKTDGEWMRKKVSKWMSEYVWEWLDEEREMRWTHTIFLLTGSPIWSRRIINAFLRMQVCKYSILFKNNITCISRIKYWNKTCLLADISYFFKNMYLKFLPNPKSARTCLGFHPPFCTGALRLMFLVRSLYHPESFLSTFMPAKFCTGGPGSG